MAKSAKSSAKQKTRPGAASATSGAKPVKALQSASGAPAKSGALRKSWKRLPGSARTERRFAPRASSADLAGVLGTSLGAVAVGAGVYAQFVSKPAHTFAPYMLGAGALVAGISFFLGGRPVAIRVGDLGIGVEKSPDNIERMAWYEVDSVRFAANVLSFSGKGRVLSISQGSHPDAVKLAVSEAKRRIPARITDVVETFDAPAPDAGEAVVLEPTQLAGLRCRASDRIISVEKDGCYCGKCGQAYHRSSVPEHCLTCDANLA
ncbi:MAG: hypothetical protein U0414_28960 [Polyangiaceae bacterium]